MANMPCGCDGQTARCETGKDLFACLEEVYQWLCNPENARVPGVMREAQWEAYEKVRQAYFEHTGWDGLLYCPICRGVCQWEEG